MRHRSSATFHDLQFSYPDGKTFKQCPEEMGQTASHDLAKFSVVLEGWKEMSQIYRPIDLARATGIDPILVRNYEYRAVLPPVERSPTGHRRYTEQHMQALITFQALDKGMGRRIAETIMRDYHQGHMDAVYSALHACHARLAERYRRHQAVLAALEQVKIPESTEEAPSLTIRAASQALGLEPPTLRFWEGMGLICPNRDPVNHYRSYTPSQLRQLHLIALLRAQEIAIPQIKILLDWLHGGTHEHVNAMMDAWHQDILDQSQACLQATARFWEYVEHWPMGDTIF